MELFSGVQSTLVLGMLVIALGIKGWALFDAFRRRTDAFPAAGKLTKPIWLGILGFTLAVQVVILNPLSILNLLGAVAAIVYLVDVRPAVSSLEGGRGSGGTHMGPYGPW